MIKSNHEKKIYFKENWKGWRKICFSILNNWIERKFEVFLLEIIFVTVKKS